MAVTDHTVRVAAKDQAYAFPSEGRVVVMHTTEEATTIYLPKGADFGRARDMANLINDICEEARENSNPAARPDGVVAEGH